MRAYQQTLNGIAMPSHGLGEGFLDIFSNIGGGGGGNEAFFAFAKRQDAALEAKRRGTITGIAVVGGVALAGLALYLVMKK